MAGRAAYKEDKLKHEHVFLRNNFCECGCERVTKDQYQTRVKEWEEYYQKVKSTVSYKSWRDCKEFFSRNRMDAVKVLAQEARYRLEKQDFLPKPYACDPDLEKHKGKLFIIWS